MKDLSEPQRLAQVVENLLELAPNELGYTQLL
jgi:hypothetical protein